MMSLLGAIKRFLGLSKPFIMPNPLIPWEIFADQNPVVFNSRQGDPEFWLTFVWIPYWASLSDKERVAMKRQAPSQDWVDFMERMEEGIPYTQEFLKNNGYEFDHTPHLEWFIENYTKRHT